MQYTGKSETDFYIDMGTYMVKNVSIKDEKKKGLLIVLSM